MLQAAPLDCLLFDPLPLFQNCLPSSEVNVRWCEISKALMVSAIVIVVDECRDLIFQIRREEVVLQQDPVLECLMPTFDFALCLRMTRCTMYLLH